VIVECGTCIINDPKCTSRFCRWAVRRTNMNGVKIPHSASNLYYFVAIGGYFSSSLPSGTGYCHEMADVVEPFARPPNLR
jgi:hypothetical protein